MADDRQRKILKVKLEFATVLKYLITDRLQVFRKFSYSLGPEVSELLEEILDHHEIADEDIESSLETLVVEYSKQDGKLLAFLVSSGLQ
jgi:DNA polymerase epsilon subunit 2